MRLALYARVSSDRQEREGTIASQVASLRSWAAEHDAPEAELIADDGVSGATLERPGMARVLELLRARAIDALAVHDLDRLSRDRADLFTVIKLVNEAGAALYVVKSGQRWEDTDEGMVLSSVFAMVAELERRKIRERARRGMAHRARIEGRKNGGIPSFGFVVEDGRYLLDAEEVGVCRQISAWLLEGVTPGLIAQRLMVLQVPTKYDRLGIVRRGSRRAPCTWYPDQVRRILTDELYAGTWRYRTWTGETIETPVPAIFTRDELEAHRRVIGRHVSLRPRQGPVNILRSLVTCGVCGRRYVAGVASGQRIYRCGVWHRPRMLRDCANKSWTAKRLEAAVWKAVAAFVLEPGRVLAGLRAAGEDPDRPELRLAQLERRLAQLAQEDERIRAALYRSAIYTLDQAEAELAKSQRARLLIEGEVRELRGRVGQARHVEDLEAVLAVLRERIDSIDAEARGAVLAEIVDRITVTGERIEIDLILPANETAQPIPSVGRDHVVLRSA